MQIVIPMSGFGERFKSPRRVREANRGRFWKTRFALDRAEQLRDRGWDFEQAW